MIIDTLLNSRFIVFPAILHSFAYIFHHILWKHMIHKFLYMWTMWNTRIAGGFLCDLTVCICRIIARARQEAASCFRSNGYTGWAVRAILKDDTLADELIVAAVKSEQTYTNTASASDPHSDIVCLRYGGANHLARYSLSWRARRSR